MLSLFCFPNWKKTKKKNRCSIFNAGCARRSAIVGAINNGHSVMVYLSSGCLCYISLLQFVMIYEDVGVGAMPLNLHNDSHFNTSEGNSSRHCNWTERRRRYTFRCFRKQCHVVTIDDRKCHWLRGNWDFVQIRNSLPFRVFVLRQMEFGFSIFSMRASHQFEFDLNWI